MMQHHRFLSVICGILTLSAFCLRMCSAGEDAFELECRDGFVLEGIVASPEEVAAGEAQQVVILLHGSGPQSMDEDLSAATEGGKQNLFFKEISDVLVDVGFTVVRYHKRSFQSRLSIGEDPTFVQSEVFQGYSENPLKYFVDDAVDCVRHIQGTIPEAEIHLLGHSQGCYVGLQAAHQIPEIKGVALVGFYLSGMETAVLEQIVYRPMGQFRELDTDGNNSLDVDELSVDGPVPAQLRPQMPVIDLDGNGEMSFAELKAGNLSNLLIRDMGLAVMTRQEANYPRTADILKDAEFKVIFLQGMWDNQTPAYHAKAVELTNRHVWMKDTFRFTYFPELGHALDRRDRYEDIIFDTIDPDAKQTLADQLHEFF